VYTVTVLQARLFSGHLEDDEVVSIVVHKHWLVGVKYLTPPALSFLLALAFLSGAQVPAVFYTVSLWAMLSLLWLVRNFFDYYMDAWLITNMGVIDLEWHGWFHRQSSRILYSDIEGISYEIKGVVGTIMRIGTLSVEKISTGSAITLSYVQNPRAVEAVVLKNKEAYLTKKNLKDATHVQDVLSAMVARELQLKGMQPTVTPVVELEPEAELDNTEEPEKKKTVSFSSSRIGSRSKK
jgi:hypothetical protein